MSRRYPDFDPAALPAAARAVHDEIVARRGYLPGPYRFWLAAPGYAQRMEQVEDYLRHQVSLDGRLVELVVLLCARHWKARYVWSSHAPAALAAGLAPATVDAIRRGAVPALERAEEAACHALCHALLEGDEIDDALWAEARARLGEQGITELLGLIGLYASACLTMVAYRVPTKNAEPDPFAP